MKKLIQREDPFLGTAFKQCTIGKNLILTINPFDYDYILRNTIFYQLNKTPLMHKTQNHFIKLQKKCFELMV